MATFICIHGSWHGGWCFDSIRPLLERAGHAVLTPNLPGMGGDAAALRDVTLQGWAEFAADLCRQADDRPVILVGHSRAGIQSGNGEQELHKTHPIPVLILFKS